MKTKVFSTLIACILCFLLNAQDLNREITENTNKPYLLGKIDKSGLEKW